MHIPSRQSLIQTPWGHVVGLSGRICCQLDAGRAPSLGSRLTVGSPQYKTERRRTVLQGAREGKKPHESVSVCKRERIWSDKQHPKYPSRVCLYFCRIACIVTPTWPCNNRQFQGARRNQRDVPLTPPVIPNIYACVRAVSLDRSYEVAELLDTR